MEKENFRKSAIVKLLYGEINSDNIKMTDKYNDIMDSVTKFDDELTEKLATIPELAELFKSFKIYYDKASIEETNAYFEYGFKNGLLLGLEIVSTE